MANLKSLVKDTAIYGISSIFGRFLNFCLVPLYTYTLHRCSDYGIVVDLYAQTALLLVILTFGMETTFFRFINKEDDPEKKKLVYSTALTMVGGVALVFALLTVVFINPLSSVLGYAEHKWFVGMLYLCVAQDAWQAIMFAYLRNQHRPIKFACLKMVFIIMSVALNLVCFYFLPKSDPTWVVDVKWVFIINLFCTTTISVCMVKEWTCVRWIFDKKIAVEMLKYTWPLLILGIAGILNLVAGQIMLPRVLGKEEGRHLLGIYEAGVKIAMIMGLIAQAFRYAYEPFVFGSSKDKGSKDMYAVAMKYFIVFTLLAFLCVVGYMDLLKYVVGEKYREGMGVTPIVMASEIIMGISLNLSFWYKLIDKTIYGAWFSVAGCAVLFVFNLVFIPVMGYWACAWACFAGYGTTMLLSYFFGQKYNPINYPLKSIGFYALTALIFYAGIYFVNNHFDNMWGRMGINTVIIAIYLVIIVYEFKKNRHRSTVTAEQ